MLGSTVILVMRTTATDDCEVVFFNPYAAGGQYRIMLKSSKITETPQMGTHLRALSESLPMSPNMTGFR